MTTLKSFPEKSYFFLTGHAFLLPLAHLNVNLGEFDKVTVVATENWTLR